MPSHAGARTSPRSAHPPRASLLPVLPASPTGAALTREKLLQAAHELLFERGGAEPSVSQICRRAGVQVAMVSYCFGGKTQLLEALVERATMGVVAELQRFAAQKGLEPEEMLRRHVAAMVRNWVRFPYLMQLIERAHAGDPQVERITTIFVGPALEFYRGLLARGAKARKFRKVDPTLFFFSIVGSCQFLFTARSLLATSGEALNEDLVERFIEHTAELLVRGISLK
ncbi:TetR family transcriptional regulator [Pendulispora rubella]|uniref:TetR family transcriptional regulator n=1 Tax=Pendulispora rubella TaxID=2741070 RepID=A0ABZ2L1A1_9BACT